MTIPTVPVGTTNCDAPTDAPATWRADVLDLTTKFNELIAALGAGGTPADAATLRAALDATTTGSALITAADAAAVRAAAGIAPAGVLVYESTSPFVGSSNITIGNTENHDASGAYNTGTKLFTAPNAGLYQVSAGASFSVSTAGELHLKLNVGGTALITVRESIAVGQLIHMSFSAVVSLTAAQTVGLSAQCPTTGQGQLQAGLSGNYFSVLSVQ